MKITVVGAAILVVSVLILVHVLRAVADDGTRTIGPTGGSNGNE
jgi:hypothetical protein